MIVVPYDGKIWMYGPESHQVVAEPVFEEDYPQLGPLRDYMMDIMRRTGAIGLAAPQVGVFKQFIMVEMSDGGIMDMINPDIIGMTGKEIVGLETCLSVPPAGNDCGVPRMQRIIVECSTIKAPKSIGQIALGNRDSVVVQHEIDHLTGTYFFDRVGSAVQRSVVERFNRWKLENISNGQSKLIPSAGK